MTKIISVIALQIVLLCFVPTVALAEQTPVKFSVSHNNDSDGVSYLSYSMATEKMAVQPTAELLPVVVALLVVVQLVAT